MTKLHPLVAGSFLPPSNIATSNIVTLEEGNLDALIGDPREPLSASNAGSNVPTV